MIKAATKDDSTILAELAIQMWNEHSIQELTDDFSNILSGGNAQCFIKYIQNVPIGFAQCQLRYDYVEGTNSSPVGYLEGIFIKEAYQHKGYAKELLHACEKWAKEKGCTEFASDCELENTNSLHFHMAMGFHEANRIICFHKSLE